MKHLQAQISKKDTGLRYGKPSSKVEGATLYERINNVNTLIELRMFTLEPLVEMPTIQNIEFIGLPEWFTTCLTMRIRGEGGDLLLTEWPVKTVKRKVDSWRADRRVQVSTGHCSQPVYDWREFALRNGIALPKDAERIFPPTQETSLGRVVA